MAEPVDKHTAGCAIWTSDDPADDCDCRDPAAHRRHLENEWRHLTLAERCRRYDALSAS